MKVLFSSKSTRFNPYFGSHNYKRRKPAKVGIKSCRFARECVSFALREKLAMFLY